MKASQFSKGSISPGTKGKGKDVAEKLEKEYRSWIKVDKVLSRKRIKAYMAGLRAVIVAIEKIVSVYRNDLAIQKAEYNAKKKTHDRKQNKLYKKSVQENEKNSKNDIHDKVPYESFEKRVIKYEKDIKLRNLIEDTGKDHKVGTLTQNCKALAERKGDKFTVNDVFVSEGTIIDEDAIRQMKLMRDLLLYRVPKYFEYTMKGSPSGKKAKTLFRVPSEFLKIVNSQTNLDIENNNIVATEVVNTSFYEALADFKRGDGGNFKKFLNLQTRVQRKIKKAKVSSNFSISFEVTETPLSGEKTRAISDLVSEYNKSRYRIKKQAFFLVVTQMKLEKELKYTANKKEVFVDAVKPVSVTNSEMVLAEDLADLIIEKLRLQEKDKRANQFTSKAAKFFDKVKEPQNLSRGNIDMKEATQTAKLIIHQFAKIYKDASDDEKMQANDDAIEVLQAFINKENERMEDDDYREEKVEAWEKKVEILGGK